MSFNRDEHNARPRMLNIQHELDSSRLAYLMLEEDHRKLLAELELVKSELASLKAERRMDSHFDSPLFNQKQKNQNDNDYTWYQNPTYYPNSHQIIPPPATPPPPPSLYSNNSYLRESLDPETTTINMKKNSVSTNNSQSSSIHSKQ